MKRCAVFGCTRSVMTLGCVRCPVHIETMAPLEQDLKDAEIADLAAARREERERCAKVAERGPRLDGGCNLCRDIAAEIRALPAGEGCRTCGGRGFHMNFADRVPCPECAGGKKETP